MTALAVPPLDDPAEPLWARTAVQLTMGFQSGCFDPIDVLDAVLGRIETVNNTVNAIIALDLKEARAAAQRAAARWRAGTPRSALDGVPLTIKDNLHVAGLPATWGSRLHQGFVPETDEPAVASLRRAGAVILGKTNVPEFTLQGYTDNLLFGRTINPHAPGLTPGGSTGGGAASVAAGFGPIAIGTDGGGSIRRPAAHCGLWGFKPSIGQIARYGGFPQILLDFEVIGPVARTLGDIVAAFTILKGLDARDPRSLMALAASPGIPPRPRVAFLPRISAAPVDPAITARVARFAEDLRSQGCIVEEIEFPFDFDALGAIWGTVASVGLAWHLAKYPGVAGLVGGPAHQTAAAGAQIPAGRYLDALASAGEARAAAAAFFENWDILLTPTTAALAWPADQMFPPQIDGVDVGARGHAVFTGWMNVLGLAALSVPVAMTETSGGIGVQLAVPPGHDEMLLAFARRFSGPGAQGFDQ
jgi:aspartyl-tRNA(Asn)/glutamyl-tRNA(Gln) amidotransferase subunit A